MKTSSDNKRHFNKKLYIAYSIGMTKKQAKKIATEIRQYKTGGKRYLARIVPMKKKSFKGLYYVFEHSPLRLK